MAEEAYLDTLEGVLVSTLKAVSLTNRRLNSLTSTEDDDDDDDKDSQSSLNNHTIWDFLKGALK